MFKISKSVWRTFWFISYIIILHLLFIFIFIYSFNNINNTEEPDFLQIYHISDSKCQVTEVHIALTGIPNEMQIIWRTTMSGCPSKVTYSPYISNNLIWNTIEGYEIFHTENMFCGPPANQSYLNLTMHSALLTDLLPNMQYKYFINGDNRAFLFTSGMQAGDKSSYKFIAVGDIGVSMDPDGENVAAKDFYKKLLKDKDEYNLLLILGDLSYSDGRPFIWDQYMALIQSFASSVPFMVINGNHEYGYVTGCEKDLSAHEPFLPIWGDYENDSGGECGMQYLARFPISFTSLNSWIKLYQNKIDGLKPYILNQPFAPFWYSFNYGLVHFIILSVEHDFTNGSDQYDWLISDLKGVDREKTPWIILSMHRPMYVPLNSSDHVRVGIVIQEELEPLIKEYKINIILSGHIHAYCRSCKVLNNVCDNDGAYHILLGSGGRELNSKEPLTRTWVKTLWKKFGYGKFTVENEQIMYFEFIGVDGSYDSAILERETSIIMS